MCLKQCFGLLEREKRKWGIFLRKGEKREAKQERGDDWLCDPRRELKRSGE
jgi:hypothetical protein